MNRNQIKCMAGLLLCALSLTALAAEDPNVKLMKGLYTKIGQTVGVGSNDPQTGESFLVLANPGILLDPTLQPQTPAGRALLARTLDRVLKPDWIYKTSADATFDVYKKILDSHEAADIQPTLQQKNQYKAACQLIFTDCSAAQPGTYTSGFQTYQDLKGKLATAAKAAIDYQTANNTADLPADIANNLSAATQNLDLLGNRVNLEGAQAKINTYEHIDPNAWWGELRGRFQKNSDPLGNYGYYNVYPSYPVWLDMNTSWSKLTLNQTDLEQTTSNSHTSVGGGVSASWGLWSVGADYSHQENRTFFQLDASGMTVSMEIMRVVLDRPWLDAAVFQSQAWKWQKGSIYDLKLISDGGNAVVGATPTGVMPFLPTGLLLARRVSLSGNWSHDLKTTFDQQTSGGASIGWGPISFGGRYNSSDSSTYTKANAAGNTVAWDAPQIIGFFVDVLPKSPNPYRCYKFPSDTQPLPADCTQPPGGGHFAPALRFAPGVYSSRLKNSADLLKSAKSILAKYKALHSNQ